MKLRILADILIVIISFVLPSWAVFSFGLICLVFFDRYYEILFLGTVLDGIYGLQSVYFGHFYFFVSVILFLIAYFFKKHLRF